MQDAAVAYIGKLPTHDDFVRQRASTPTMRALDDWVRTGLHRARQDRPEWEAVYDAAPLRRFVLWGEGPRVPNGLVGVLRPSRDANRRPYPLVVAREIPGRALPPTHAAYLPVQAQPFLSAAAQLVRRAATGAVSRDALRRRAEALPDVPLRSTMPRTHRHYLQEETIDTFRAAVFETDDEDAELKHLRGLLKAIRTPPDAAATGSGAAVRLPVRSDETAVHDLGFWMGLLLRLRTPETPPSLFWAPPAPGSDDEPALLYPSPPSPVALFDVLAPERAGARVRRPAAERPPAEADPPLPAGGPDLFRRDHLRLHTVLRRL
jgi:type VI secretion system ImpM family protein